VFANAKRSLGCCPEDGASEPVRVAFDHRVEVAGGGVLGAQLLLGDVEVLPCVGDRACRVVVEFRVLVAGDDVASAQRLDLVDRGASFVEARERRLAEVQVGAASARRHAML
jgi:hypothetical protein